MSTRVYLLWRIFFTIPFGYGFISVFAGVLLLVIGEGKGWATVGTGAESFLPANRLDSILNTYLWDEFDQGNYDKAVQDTFGAILQQYESYYGITISANQTGASDQGAYYDDYDWDYDPNPTPRSHFSLAQVMVILVFLVILFAPRRGGRGSLFSRIFLFSAFRNSFRHPPHDPWDDHGPHGPRGPGGPGGPGRPGAPFGGGFSGRPRGGSGFHGGGSGFRGGGGGSFGGGGGRGGGAGRR